MLHGLVPSIINVVILVALLAYYLREPLKNVVTSRHSGLRDELERVGQQLKNAEIQYQEFSTKLQAIDLEVREIREQARSDAQAMKARVVADAKRLAEMIVSDSRASANALFSDIKEQIRKEFGTQVVDRAEELLRARLTQDDRIRIRQEFSKQVESVQ